MGIPFFSSPDRDEDGLQLSKTNIGKFLSSPDRGKDGPQPIETDIGKCLRYSRAAYRLTLKDVAAQTGIPLKTLGRYEHGEGHIPCYMLWTLSNFLRVPITRFFEFEPAEEHYKDSLFYEDDVSYEGEYDEEENDGRI